MEGEKATSSKTKRAFERNLSFLAFLEAGQIKVSRVLNWGRRHDVKQIPG